jgi:gliding motility-associated-like protein
MDLKDSVEGYMEGGSWSPNAPNGIFNPIDLEKDKIHTVTYSLKDSYCQKIISHNFYLKSPPKLEITPLPSEICKYHGEINLEEYNNSPYQGNWLLDNESIGTTLNPLKLANGKHTLVYRRLSHTSSTRVECLAEYQQNIFINEGRQVQRIGLDFCGLIGHYYDEIKFDTVINTHGDELLFINEVDSIHFEAKGYGEKQLKLIELDNLACKNVASFVLNFSQAPPVSDAGEDIYLKFNEEDFNLDAQQPTIGIGEWILFNQNLQVDDLKDEKSRARVVSEPENKLVWRVSNGVCPVLQDTVWIYKDFLELVNAFSPNGDGKNDFFSIEVDDKDAKITFEVLNRWGQKVYEIDDYVIEWDGNDSRQKPVPDGVYFYRLKIGDTEEIKGKLTIRR